MAEFPSCKCQPAAKTVRPGRHRTADSTAPTSKIPNVYGPQDDRTAKTPPRPPQPVAHVKRSSLLRCPARLKARFPVRFRRRQAHCGSASWARSARLHASTTPRRVKGLSFAKEDLPSAIQPAIRSLLPPWVHGDDLFGLGLLNPQVPIGAAPPVPVVPIGADRCRNDLRAQAPNGT